MIREKRKFSNQPIGVVKQTEASASAETYKALSKIGTNIAGALYKQGVKDAEALGVQQAEQVVLPALDDEGYFTKVQLPNAGSVRQEAFDKTLKYRMEKDIDVKLRTIMTGLSQDPQYKNSPTAFQEASSIHLDAIITNASPELKAFVQQTGSTYQALNLTKVQANEFKEKEKMTTLLVQEESLVLANDLEVLIQDGGLDQALEKYAQFKEYINNTNELTVPHKREYKSYARIAILQGVLANATRGMNKAEVNDFRNQFLTQRSTLPEFNKVLEQIGGDSQDIEAVGRYLSKLAGVTDPASKPIGVGNSDTVRQGVEQQIVDNIGTGPNGEPPYMQWRNPEYKRYVERHRAIPDSLYRTIKAVENGAITDTNTIYDLFKMHEAYSTVITDNGFLTMNKSYFPEKFSNRMRAVRHFMDLEDSPEYFGKVYNHVVNDNMDYQSMGVSLGLDANQPIGKSQVEDAIRMKLVDNGKPIDMTTEMANKFVDEAMMVMHASQFGGDNRPPMDINTALDLVSSSINEFYKHDDIVTSNMVRFNEDEIFVRSGNITDVNTTTNGNTLIDAGSEVHNLTNTRKTIFALDTTLQPERFIGIKPLFTRYVERLANLNREGKHIAGDNLLLEVDNNSSLTNARYMLMGTDADGYTSPIMYKNTQTPIIVSTGNFIRSRYNAEPKIQDILQSKAFEINQKQKAAKNIIGDALGVIMGSGNATGAMNLGDTIANNMPDVPFIEGFVDDKYEEMFQSNQMELPDVLDDDFFEMTYKDYTDEYDVGFFQKYSIKNNRPTFSGYSSIERNNPLNIRLADNDWQGKVQGPSKEFETFNSMVNGYRAGLINMNSYRQRMPNMTLADMINTWAPPKGKRNDGTEYTNPTSNYLKFVSDQSEVLPNQKLDLADESMMVNIFRAMTMFEVGESYHAYGGDARFIPEIINGVRAGINNL